MPNVMVNDLEKRYIKIKSKFRSIQIKTRIASSSSKKRKKLCNILHQQTENIHAQLKPAAS